MSSLIKDRIDAFCAVRDLPYFIATQGEDDCCCSTKAYLLEKKLLALGVRSRHRLCFFKWEALSLPPKILGMAHEALPSHQFLEVLLPESGEWVMVDATWDRRLSSILPINEWDGVSSTKCAVPVERFCSEQETASIFKECEDPKAVSAYFETHGPFLRAINRYFAEVRER